MLFRSLRVSCRYPDSKLPAYDIILYSIFHASWTAQDDRKANGTPVLGTNGRESIDGQFQAVRTSFDFLYDEAAQADCVDIKAPFTLSLFSFSHSPSQQCYSQDCPTSSSTSSQEQPWIFLVQVMCLSLASIYMEGLTKR